MGSIPGHRTNIPHASEQLNRVMQLLSPQDTPKFSSAAAKTLASQTNKYFRRGDGACTSGGGKKWAGSGRILQVEPKWLRVGGMTRRGKHVYRVHRLGTWKPGATFRAGDSAVGRVGLGEDRGRRPDMSALTQTKMKPRQTLTKPQTSVQHQGNYSARSTSCRGSF